MDSQLVNDLFYALIVLVIELDFIGMMVAVKMVCNMPPRGKKQGKKRTWIGSSSVLNLREKPAPAPPTQPDETGNIIRQTPRTASNVPAKPEKDPVEQALDADSETNINYDTSISSVENAQHLTNLWRHMNRTARKYDSVRDHVRKQTILPLKEGEQYRPTLVHMFVTAKYSGPRTETDEILWRICVLSAKHVCKDYPKQVLACTVVAGEQPDGTQIMPCIHLIADVKDLNEAKLIANSLLATDIKDSDLK